MQLLKFQYIRSNEKKNYVSKVSKLGSNFRNIQSNIHRIVENKMRYGFEVLTILDIFNDFNWFLIKP